MCGRSKRCIGYRIFRRFSLFVLCIFDALINQCVSHRSCAIIRRARAYNTLRVFCADVVSICFVCGSVMASVKSARECFYLFVLNNDENYFKNVENS